MKITTTTTTGTTTITTKSLRLFSTKFKENFFPILFVFFVAHFCQSNAQENCFDEHMHCGFWATENECSANPKWMLVHCRLSCNICTTKTIKTPIAVPIKPAKDSQQNLFAIPTKPFSVQSTCGTQIQTQEIATRIVPTGNEYRDRAFRIGCAIANQPNICAQNTCFHENFRTFDGSCNNLQQPMKGTAYSPYARLLKANYEDGIDRMIGATPGNRPNPRDVTHLLLSTRVAIPTQLNSLVMVFGQFLSHDLSRITMINTCTCQTNTPQCANIPIPQHDTKRGQCIPFSRSIPLCGTGPTGRTPRTPMNENTAFIDASNVYGSDPRTASELRNGAFIKIEPFQQRIFPPPSGKDNIMVGDNRANLFIGLAAFHTIFVRFHNKLAGNLKQMNRHWDSERVFQETRKIIGATIQVITYQEFVPALLGAKATQLIPAYSGFKPEVEPAISAEFSSAAYRLHGMIREFYRLVDKNFRPVGDIKFIDGAGKIEKLLESGTDLLLRGMITVASKKPQRLTTQVTEDLFGLSDMGSLNIQRGRDHGLMNYNSYRQLCKLPKLTSFSNWPEVLNVEVRERVSDLYGDEPDRLDLYVGGLLEEPIDGSLLGPTFSCILAEQFQRTRDGDRFFYLNAQQYSQAQIAALSRLTLARLICETGEDFPAIPRNAFLVDSGANAIPCVQIQPLDLTPWKEE